MSMLREQVDQQVARVERTLKSERERCLHGYTFARMYMRLSPKADHLAAAEKQLKRYLSVQDNNHGAHKMMGQVYVEQKRFAEAITHFRRSLEIKGDQPELVITVAELYCKLPQDSVPLQQLECWLEKLMEVAPYGSVFVSLKEAVLKAKGEEEAGVLEQLLTTQLTHSRDVALHARLLSLLCAEGQWEKAFERARLTDMSGLFVRESTWNQKALHVYECFYYQIRSSGSYSPSSEVTVLLSLLRSSARCFLIALREETDCRATCAGLLLKMDKCMLAATRKIRLLSLEEERTGFNHLVVREMGGTLYYLTALHLLASARLEDVDRMMSVAAVCLLACLRAPLPPSNGQWVSGVTLEEAESVRAWAACRLSHTCHLLHLIQMALGGPDGIENSTVRQWSTIEGRAKLLHLLFGGNLLVLFGNKPVKFDRNESFLNFDSGLLQLEGAWSQVPSHSDLSGVDQTLVCSDGNNLHAILWLCLNYHFVQQTPPIEEWVQCLFVDLKLSTPNPARISYDTLCQLDMEATLLLLLNHCLEEVGSMVEKSRTEGGAQQIATLLCTVFLASVTVKEDLARFWHNALRLHAGTASAHELPQVKVFVQSGLAHVRSAKSSPLSMDHMALLGRHFRDRAENVAKLYQKKPWFFKDVVRDLLQYSCRYWEQIIARLSEPDTPQGMPTIRLYSVPDVVSGGGADEQQLVEDGHMTLAYLALHEKDPERAVHHYQLARTPHAAYNCSQVYIHLASQDSGRERSGERRRDLLVRAQRCVERALHQLSPGNKTWQQKLKQKLTDVMLMLDEDADIEVLQRLTYGSADESEVHYLSSYSFSRDDIHSSSHDRMGGVAHGDIDGSDESGSYGDEDIDWDDEGEESDGDVDDGSESELNLGREVLDDGRDFLARDDYGEERVISRFTDTQTYSVEEEDAPSSVHSFHTDSSGHEVEEFRLSRRSHLDLVRALEGRNNEMQRMKDHIKNLERDLRMLRKHQPKVPSSGHVYVSPRKVREEGSHSPDGDTPSHPRSTPLRHAPPPSDAGTLAGSLSMTTPNSGGKTAAAKGVEGVSPDGAVSMVIPPISWADDSSTSLKPVFEGNNTVVWGTPPPSLAPSTPYSVPPTSKPPTSFFANVRPPVVVQAQGDQRVPSSMASMLNRDSLRTLMEPINFRAGSSLSEGHESVEESEEVGETEDDEAPTPDLRHPLMVSAQFTPPRRSTWQCPTCLKGGISSNTCPLCHTCKPESTSKSISKSKMEVEPSPAEMQIKWNLPTVSADSSVPLPLSGLNLTLPTPNLSTSHLMKQPEELQEDASEVNPEEEADIHFKPVVSLPEKYEVKRGEEEEDVVFTSRAKLFRFDGKEWKERGVGELKMLRNRQSGKVRLLMRRDQVLKICCNHFLSADMTLHPMSGSDRAWSWFTSCEFSEGEARAEKLAARFKNAELAMKFKEAFEKYQCPSSPPTLLKHAQDWMCIVCGKENSATTQLCPRCIAQHADTTPVHTPSEIYQQDTTESGSILTLLNATLSSAGVSPKSPRQPVASAGVSPWTPPQPVITEELDEAGVMMMEMGVSPQSSTPQLPVVTKDTDEVIITQVEEATLEQKEKARKFKLPENFYLYLSRPSCPGCRGCTDDLTGTDASTDLNIKPKGRPVPRVSTQEPSPSAPGPFGRFVSMSFSDFTKGMPNTFDWMTEQDSGGFRSGGQIFGRQVKGDQEGDEDEVNPEEEADIHFKPVVSLPERYEVKRGEEKDDVVFASRAKLFRFDGKEWKERGIGELKILRNRQSGKVRLLMRRDQVLKICCNHFLSADMTLHPMSGSDKAWSWFTSCEFSEGEAQAETLAARFKDVELAVKFKRAFVEAQRYLQGPPQLVDDKEDTAAAGAMPDLEDDTSVAPDDLERPPAPPSERQVSYSSEGGEPLPTVFIPPTTSHKAHAKRSDQVPIPSVGEWECVQCQKWNPHHELWCVSCMGPIDKGNVKWRGVEGIERVEGVDSGKLPPKDWSATSTRRNPFFNFPGSVLSDGSAEGKQPEQGSEVLFNQLMTQTAIKPSPPSAAGNITEGMEQQVKEIGTTSSSQSTFGQFAVGSLPTFESLAGKGSASGLEWLKGEGSTGFSTGAPLFQMEKREDQEEHEVNPEEEADIHFKPVVSLPEKYEVKRGEEEEDVVFTSRAKLFRFDTEWKERGVGELKMLRNRQSGKVRLLMRRDQVLKICCNHFLSADMTLHPMSGSDKAWSWFTSCEFSEGEARAEKLAARFKNVELAMKFKEMFEGMKQPQQALAEFGETAAGLPLSTEVEGEREGGKEGVQGSKAPSNTSEASEQDNGLESSGFPLLSQRAPGSWDCSACLVVNGPDCSTCPCCGTTRPGAAPQTTVGKEAPRQGNGKVSDLKLPQPSGDSWSCPTCLVDNDAQSSTCPCCQTTRPGLKRQTDTAVSAASPLDPVGIPITTQQGSFSSLSFPNLPLQPPPTGSGLSIPFPSSQPISGGLSIPFPSSQPISGGLSIPFPSSQPISGDLSIPFPSSQPISGDLSIPFSSSQPISGGLSIPFPSGQSSTSEVVTDEVEVVKVEVASPDQVQEARKYQLPDNFYLYKTRPPCSGCRGCTDDLNGQDQESARERRGRERKKEMSDTSAKQGMVDAEIFGGNHIGTSRLNLSWLSGGHGFSSGTPLFGSLGQSGGDPGGDEDEVNPEEEADIHFKPVVSLPEKYEVKRGEEEEDVVFTSRAKLFRFDGKEWKERGVGELKMLRNRQSGKVRLLMRRDQVLKICCNHFLSADMTLHPMSGSDRAWSWFTSCEFSEGEARAETLAARFKSPQIANEFKVAVAACLQSIAEGSKPTEPTVEELVQPSNISSQASKLQEEVQGAAQVGEVESSLKQSSATCSPEISVQLEELLVRLRSTVDTGKGQVASGECIEEESLSQLSKAQLETAAIAGEYSPPTSPVAGDSIRPSSNTDSWETQEEEELHLSQPRSVDGDEGGEDTIESNVGGIESLQLDIVKQEQHQEAPPPEEPHEEAPPPEEPHKEAPPPEEPHEEAPPPEEPLEEASPPEEPQKEAPVPEEPHKEAPPPEEPHEEAPSPEEPHKEAPPPEEPHEEAPSPEGPNEEASPPEEPQKEAPLPEEPQKGFPPPEESHEEAPPLDEPYKEAPPPEEPHEEAPPPEEPHEEAPPPEEPHKDAPPPEEPHKEAPPPAEPHEEAPPPEEPHEEAPPPEEPHKEAPPPEEPHEEAPPSEEPHKEAPPPEEPHEEAPPPEEPHEEAPPPEEPHEEAPLLEEPHKDAPPPEEPHKEAPPPEEPHEEAPPPEEPHEEAPPPEEPHKDAPPPEEPHKEAPPPEEPHEEAPPPEEPHEEAPPPEEPHEEAPPPEEPHKDAPPPEEPHKEAPPPEEPHKDAPPPKELHKEAPPPEEPHKEAPPPEEPHEEAPPPEEPHKDAPPPEEPHKEAPPPEEPHKDAPPPKELHKEAPPPEEPHEEAPPSEEPHKEAPSPEEPHEEAPPPEEPHKDAPPPEEPHKEVPPPEEQHKEAPPPEEPHKEVPPPEEQHKEAPSPEEPHEEAPPPEEPHKDAPPPEEPHKDAPPPEEPHKEAPPPEEPHEEAPPPEKPHKEVPPPEEPHEEAPPPEEPHKDAPSPEEPHEEAPPPEEPHKEASPPEEPHKEAPPPEETHKEVPPPEEPQEDTPPPEEPHKEAPLLEEPQEDAPPPEEPHKEAPPPEEPHKEAPLSEEPQEEAPPPEEPQEGAPPPEEPQEDAPPPEEPHEEAPLSEEPQEEAPLPEEPHKESPTPEKSCREALVPEEPHIAALQQEAPLLEQVPLHPSQQGSTAPGQEIS